MKQYDDSTHVVISKEQHKHYTALLKVESYYLKVSKFAKVIFSEWHKEKRALLKMSKQQFSDVFGLDRMSVHRYENGQALPRDVEFYMDMVDDYVLQQLIQKLKEKGRK